MVFKAWPSPITSEIVAKGSSQILNLHMDGEDVYWCESRPSNGGKYTIVKRDERGQLQDLTPPSFNVRSLVHEYGGGAFTVSNGTVYACNSSDNRIYVIEPDTVPIPLTKEGIRFGDLKHTRHGIFAVAELHISKENVENFLVLISLRTGDVTKIVSGHAFYSSPTISLDEKKIAWICWNEQEMPWTNTELWIADIDEANNIHNSRRINPETEESIFQPGWGKDGELYFVTDRNTGWWNLHRYNGREIENICPIAAEMAEPLWILDRSTWTFLEGKILFTYNQNGYWKLGLLDPKSRTMQDLHSEGVYYQQLRASNSSACFIESYHNKPEAIVQALMDSHSRFSVPTLKTLHETPCREIDSEYISTPSHISFTSGKGLSHAFYYPPKNKDFSYKGGEKPPLLVTIHGGPTSQAKASWSLLKQFWTSRGFALLDVNYRGSTGYGKDYRDALFGNWGIADVEDCIRGALFTVQLALVNSQRLFIRGGSSGGYTVLRCLCEKHIFKGAACYYGIVDIESLVHDTHKFEAHYVQRLLGDKSTWGIRSPIHSVDRIKSPLILFHGSQDPVVPVNQSVLIHESLKKKGTFTELYLYPEEQHGFRQAKNIADSLDKELQFYEKVLS